MLEAALPIMQFAALAGAFGFGYWFWIRPRHATLDLQARGALALVLLSGLGGLIGGIFWWMDEPGSFAWDLPPLAARMLAAAGFSYAVAAFLVLQRPTRAGVRLFLVLLVVYLLPIAVAIVLFHLSRFDPAAFISYGFFAVTLTLAIAGSWYLVRPPTLPDDIAAGPPSTATRGWLLVVALVTGLWGLALFATDLGPSPLIWVWPGDPLSSELIGVMLLAVAAAAVASLRNRDTARLALVVVLVYGLGVTLANLWGGALGAPIRPAYPLVFGVMGLGSLALLLAKQRLMQ